MALLDRAPAKFEPIPDEYIASLTAEPVLPEFDTRPSWERPEPTTPRDFDAPVNAILPALEQHRIDDVMIVRLEMPGVDAETIDVELVGAVLRVKAVRREEKGGFGAHNAASEFRYGTYAREIALPSGVVEHSIDCSYSNGILTLRANVDVTLVRAVRVGVRQGGGAATKPAPRPRRKPLNAKS